MAIRGDFSATVNLLDVPSLPGARCKGLHELFDRTVGADPDPLAVDAALACCDRCPELRPCRRWSDTLDLAELGLMGVVAGEHHRPLTRVTRSGRTKRPA